MSYFKPDTGFLISEKYNAIWKEALERLEAKGLTSPLTRAIWLSTYLDNQGVGRTPNGKPRFTTVITPQEKQDEDDRIKAGYDEWKAKLESGYFLGVYPIEVEECAS